MHDAARQLVDALLRDNAFHFSCATSCDAGHVHDTGHLPPSSNIRSSSFDALLLHVGHRGDDDASQIHESRHLLAGVELPLPADLSCRPEGPSAVYVVADASSERGLLCLLPTLLRF